MATATKPRPRARTAEPARVEVAPADFHRLVADIIVTGGVVERDVPLRLIVLAMLARDNLHLLGPAGIAKSMLNREWGKRILQANGMPANVFEESMSPYTDEDRLLGPIDPVRLMAGELVRKSANYIPQAHLVIADELTRAGKPVYDVLLPIMNTGERHYKDDGELLKLDNLLVFLSASNHMPDPDDAALQAFVERFGFLYVVDRIKSDENFTTACERSLARTRINGGETVETITVEQIREAQRQVTHVESSPSFQAGLAKLRADVDEAGIYVGDRRWIGQIQPVCQAGAWLAGRTQLIDEDLVNAEFMIARDPNHFAIAHDLIIPFHGRFAAAAHTLRQEANPQIVAWQELKPRVESVPTTERLGPELTREVYEISHALVHNLKRVEDLIAEAEREQREAADARELLTDLEVVRAWFDANGFATPLP